MPVGDQNASEGDQEPTYKDYLVQSVLDLFMTSKYSDLTIIREDREWHVHKTIVYSRSEVFAKMCGIGMKESNENVIMLEEDDPAAVDAMLYYMYSADYDDETQNRLAPMVLDVAVYALADKYDVPGLTELAVTKFSKRAHGEWQTRPSDFATAIHDVYSDAVDSDRELRDCVLEICSTNAKELFEGDAFENFREVVQTVPAFAAELCARLASLASTPKLSSSASRRRCFYCGYSAVWPETDPVAWYTCPECNHIAQGAMWGE